MFDSRILDMFEFGILNYKALEAFPASDVPRDLKPILVFQGEQFEFSDKHRRLKNLLIGKI